MGGKVARRKLKIICKETVKNVLRGNRRKEREGSLLLRPHRSRPDTENHA
jgi:hypothetical protein